MFLRKVEKAVQPISNYCCIYKSDIFDLADLIQSPTFSEIIFGEAANYISSILFYPFYFNTNVTKNNFTGTLKVNKITSKVNCFTNGKLEQPMLFAELPNLIEKKSFLDVEPYCSYQLYLPFLGTIELNSLDILDKHIYIISNFDFQTGNLLYSIFSSPNLLKFPNSPFLDDADILTASDVYFIGQYECQCGYLLPLGSNNAVENIRNVITGTINLAGQIIAGYAQAKTPTETTTTSTTTHRTTNPKTNRLKTSSKTQNITKTSTTKNYNPAPTVIASTASILSNIQARAQFDKPYNALLKSSGSLEPVLITKRANILEMPKEFYHFYGRPLGKTKKLNELEGFTVVSEINIEGEGFENITEEEREELHTILTSGVILDGEYTPEEPEATYRSFILINSNYNNEQYKYDYIVDESFNDFIERTSPEHLSISGDYILFDNQYALYSNLLYPNDTKVLKNEVINKVYYYFKGEIPPTEQQVTIIDANEIKTFPDKTYLMPYDYTFNDFINSTYNTNGYFGIGRIGDFDVVTYYNYYIDNEAGTTVKLGNIASGNFTFNPTSIRILQVLGDDSYNIFEEICPRNYTFGQYINSKFDSTHKLSIDSSGNVLMGTYYISKTGVTSANFAKSTDSASGTFYIYDP